MARVGLLPSCVEPGLASLEPGADQGGDVQPGPEEGGDGVETPLLAGRRTGRERGGQRLEGGERRSGQVSTDQLGLPGDQHCLSCKAPAPSEVRVALGFFSSTVRKPSA